MNYDEFNEILDDFDVESPEKNGEDEYVDDFESPEK